MKELLDIIKELNELDCKDAVKADAFDDYFVKISQQVVPNNNQLILLKKQLNEERMKGYMQEYQNRKLKQQNDELNIAALEAGTEETEDKVDLSKNFHTVEPGYQPYPIRVMPNSEVTLGVL